jgi:hypothetical protein
MYFFRAPTIARAIICTFANRKLTTFWAQTSNYFSMLVPITVLCSIVEKKGGR